MHAGAQQRGVFLDDSSGSYQIFQLPELTGDYHCAVSSERVTGRWPGTSCQKQGWCIRTDGERRPQTETVRTLVRLRARLRAWSMGCCGSIIGDTRAA
jgi:hypothetical protein